VRAEDRGAAAAMKIVSGLILFAISVPAFRWCAGEMAIQLWGVETRAILRQVGRNEPRGRFAAYRAHYEFDTLDAGRAYGTAPAKRGSQGGWLRVKYLRHDPSWNTPATGWYAGALMVLWGAPAWLLSWWTARSCLGRTRRRDPLNEKEEPPPASREPTEASPPPQRVPGRTSGTFVLAWVLAALALGLNLAWFGVQEKRVLTTDPEASPDRDPSVGQTRRQTPPRGASLGNQVNGSAVAFESDFVYGAIWRDAAGGLGPEPGLYRFSREGVARIGKSGVTARIYRGVQVLDGWLYYLGMEGIHRIRTDGSRPATLTRTRATSMAVVGDTVYFQHELLRDALYRVDCDGAGERPLVREPTGAWCVGDDGWIYYANRNDDGRIWRVRPEGGGRERFLDRRVGTLLVENTGIWYTDLDQRRALVRAEVSSRDRKTVLAESVERVIPVGDALVVLLSDGTLLNLRRDGTGRAVLAAEVSSMLEHHGVLYLTKGLQTQILYRMTLGGEQMPVLRLGPVGVD
jgi:hypothetical protein